MDQKGRGQSEDSGQQSHSKNANEVEQMLGNPSQALILAPSPARMPPMVQTPASQFAIVNSSYEQMNHKREMETRQRLKTFWDNQIKDIKKMSEFKNHSLPLARIKKIMKADEDVKMISAEAPMVFAKACEMFILELTLRSWCNTEENKRRTLLKNDVTHAIARTDIFDFLVDIIPREVREEPHFSMPPRNAMTMVPVPDAPTYYHFPPQQPAVHPATSGEIRNRRLVDPNLFRQHLPILPPAYWYPPEQQDQEEQQQPPQPPGSASDS